MSWDDWDDDDDDWDDDDSPRHRGKYRKKGNASQLFNQMLFGGGMRSLFGEDREDLAESLADIREDLEDAEDEDDIEDALEDLEDLEEDIDDAWDDVWERDWDDIFDYDWDESFWKRKGSHLPLRVSCPPELKGKVGEEIIAGYLSELPHHKYHVLNDILLEIGNTSSQIDHIVVSEYGLFVVETKNYAGVVYGQENDNHWTQIIGSKKNSFYNPIRQNQRHVQVLQQCIGRPLNEFVPVVVFSRNCSLNVNTCTPVLYADTMMDFIRSFDQPIISQEEMIAIEKAIDGSWNRSFAARLRHRMRYRVKK